MKIGRAPVGVLTLYEDNRLTLEESDELKFDSNLSELQNVRSPWWTMGSAIHFNYQGKRWVCDFALGSGALNTAPGRFQMAAGQTAAGAVSGLAGAAATFVMVEKGRKLGQAWKAILDERISTGTSGPSVRPEDTSG